MSQTGSDFVGSSARSLVRHTVISRSEVSVPIGVILLFYSREGRESQDAALLMAVVGQFVASSWAAHGCRGVLQVLSRGGFPFPEGYTAA